MHPLPSPALFAPPRFALADPWADLLLPALRGELPDLPAAMAALPAGNPDGLAVACRVLVLADEQDRARRLLGTLVEQATPEALALAPWLLRRPPRPPRRGPAWQRADALCDHAAWLLLARREGAARSRLSRALDLVADHAEALHMLDHLPGPLPSVLLPRPDLGWLSPERIARRGPDGAWALPDRRDRPRIAAGLRTRLGLPAPLEAMADRVHTRRADHRPAAQEAEVLWRRVRHLGPPATLRVATWLTRLLPVDPSTAPLIDELDEVLRLCGLRPIARRLPGAIPTQRPLPR